MNFRATTHPFARLGALLALLAPMPALAAFGAAVTIAPDGKAPQVAVAPDQDSVIVWTESDGTNDRVRARTRSAAGALGPVLTLSPLGGPGQDATDPRIVMDASGDALVVWCRLDGTLFSRVQARWLSSGGVLGAVQTISPAGVDAVQPRIGLAANGRALIVWRTSSHVHARGRAVDGTLSPIQTLSAFGTPVFDPVVAVTPDFRAVVVWEQEFGPNSRVQARFRAAGGTLGGGLLDISPAGIHADNPDVAIADDGNALIVWRASESRVQARGRSSTGALGPVQNVSPANGGAAFPRVAMQRDGDAIIVWEFALIRVQARTRSAAGALGDVQDIAATGFSNRSTSPQVALDENGVAAFVWERDSTIDPFTRIQGRSRAADGTLSPIQFLSAPGFHASPGVDAGGPQISMEDDGGAVAVWERADENATGRVQASTGP